MKAHRVLTRSCVRPLNEGGGLRRTDPSGAVRTSGAFWTKAQRIARYLEQGVIGRKTRGSS